MPLRRTIRGNYNNLVNEHIAEEVEVFFPHFKVNERHLLQTGTLYYSLLYISNFNILFSCREKLMFLKINEDVFVFPWFEPKPSTFRFKLYANTHRPTTSLPCWNLRGASFKTKIKIRSSSKTWRLAGVFHSRKPQTCCHPPTSQCRWSKRQPLLFTNMEDGISIRSFKCHLLR